MTKFFKESFTYISVCSSLIMMAAGFQKRISWPKSNVLIFFFQV
jgi:hypothetical protein